MRFINADGQINGGILGKNLFTYCGNNPVVFCDPAGNNPVVVLYFLLAYVLVDIASGASAERADDFIDDPSFPKFINVLASGRVDAAKGAIFPDEPWSAQHWLDSLTLFGMISGGSSAIGGTAARVAAPAATSASKMASIAAKGRVGEALAGIEKNTTRLESILNPGKYRVPDELTNTILGEVKNYSGTLSYTSQLRDYVMISQAKGLQMRLYTNARLSWPLQQLVDSGVIELVPLG